MRLIRAALTSLALLSAARQAHADCSKDLDCGGEQVCESARCVQPRPAPPRVAGAPRVISVVTHNAPEPPPIYKHRSATMVVAGIAFVAGGLATLAIDAMHSDKTCYRDLSDGFQSEHCHHSYAAYTVAGLLIAGGIPLFILGVQKVPVRREARLGVWASPHGASLQLKLSL
jgi:hypothetical protein